LETVRLDVLPIVQSAASVQFNEEHPQTCQSKYADDAMFTDTGLSGT